MPFALYPAQPCVMHLGCASSRAAVRLPSGALAHVCLEHLVEMLGSGGSYPVFSVVGSAYVLTADETAPPALRLVQSG